MARRRIGRRTIRRRRTRMGYKRRGRRPTRFGYGKRRFRHNRLSKRRYISRRRLRQRRRSQWIRPLWDTTQNVYEANFDNSTGTHEQFYAIIPGNTINYPDNLASDFSEQWTNWLSPGTLDSILGGYRPASPGPYNWEQPKYQRFRVEKITQHFSPNVYNITSKSVAASATDQLSHSTDNIKIWYMPNYSLNVWDENWSLSTAAYIENFGKLAKIQLNSKSLRSHVIPWRNRDPYFKGKFFNGNALNLMLQGWGNATTGAPWWNSSNSVFPFTPKWYGKLWEQYQEWGTPSATPGSTDNVWTVGMLPPGNPKYALKRPGWIVLVPPGTACSFRVDVKVNTKLSVIERFTAQNYEYPSS